VVKLNSGNGKVTCMKFVYCSDSDSDGYSSDSSVDSVSQGIPGEECICAEAVNQQEENVGKQTCHSIDHDCVCDLKLTVTVLWGRGCYSSDHKCVCKQNMKACRSADHACVCGASGSQGALCRHKGCVFCNCKLATLDDEFRVEIECYNAAHACISEQLKMLIRKFDAELASRPPAARDTMREYGRWDKQMTIGISCRCHKCADRRIRLLEYRTKGELIILEKHTASRQLKKNKQRGGRNLKPVTSMPIEPIEEDTRL
jgi:hypothetical protein